MASIVLTAAAGAIAPANPFLAGALKFGAGAIGNRIDGALFGSSANSARTGPRLAELSVQTSTYGKMIPLMYGTARLAGNVIWSRPIKEVETTTTSTQSGGKGGGSVNSSSTSFTYFVSLAIAVCEGPIDDVLRVWADAKQLDLGQGTYRIYKGNETQDPDPFIESFHGVGETPAYRGLSYIVVEDFPLADYGNRIPNFTVEVKKKAKAPDVDGQAVEDMVTSVVMIPGSGEFVYDTQIQYKVQGDEVDGVWQPRGFRERINSYNPSGKANADLALDQLAETLPNVEWISVVVNWFGNSLDAGACSIRPGVEYQTDATTEPEEWTVAGYTRSSAHAITYEGGTPRYGGTPDDQSLVRYIDAIKARGYKVMLLPMPLMDVAGKPWRGRITGSYSDTSNFFTKTEGYNLFVQHYASLLSGKLDGIAIGSELIGLTKVHDGASVNRDFPAVSQLINLSNIVRALSGTATKITYAADWSEYHHTEGGWYNMDALWAAPNIDVIGIDAYFPLTNAAQNELGYDIDSIKAGWTSGEGYSFYYTDGERTTTAPLDAPYAWKNIDWFWNNTHYNPDGNPTAWVPASKKFWLTEYGFPSVDGASNQPNVFYDPSSTESFFPRFSKGRTDFRAQRTAIAATESQWANSAMVERLFLWTWDARPFPYWPDLLEVWADGPVWKTGHWVQGKFGLSSLAAIVADLCARVGLSSGQVDVTRLTERVEGYILSAQDSARDAIEALMQAYFFDAVESDGVLKFMPRGNATALTIDADTLIPQANSDKEEILSITRAQELELPAQVDVVYLNRLANYQVGTQRASRQTTESSEIAKLNLPIVMANQYARVVADIALYNAWMQRTSFAFDVPMRYADLEPTDVITITQNGFSHVLRITSTHYGRPGLMRVRGIAEDVSVYDFYTQAAGDENDSSLLLDTDVPAQTNLEFLDIPAFPSDPSDKGVLRFAASPQDTGWRGASLFRSDDAGGTYAQLASFDTAAVMGTALTVLPAGVTHVFDEVNSIDVNIIGAGELASATEEAVLNGANALLLGDEIVQFKTAILITEGKYRLSGLLRGRQGTQWAMDSHMLGERVVLLNNALRKEIMPSNLLGLLRLYKPVTLGRTLGQTDEESFTYTGNALRPYAPVHLSAVPESNGDFTLSWVRRTRLGGEWRDFADAPLSEESERYEVEILDGTEVVRTLTTSTPTLTYSAAEQTADFGSVQSAVRFRVYQLSALIGRGRGAVSA